MRSLVKVLIVLVVILIAIGFYRGWFGFSRSVSDQEGNKVEVKMSVDKGKIKSDVSKAEEKVKEEVRELEEKVKAKGAK